MMNFYGQDHSLLGLSFSDLFVETLNHDSLDSPSDLKPSTSADELNREDRNSSPPKHRHDGSSPLPLGMDWSPAPRKLDGGRGSVWPHDPRSGWSYCVTVPSWTILPDSSGSAPIVFYRVQVGVQSPEAITTIHGMLHRYSDFLRLFSQLQSLFPDKSLPIAPPRKLLRNKSRTFLEERRCSLEDWMEKLLSDIDVSRSAPVADFLELEVAARSSFNDTSASAATSSHTTYQSSLDISLRANTSSVMSDYGDDTLYEGSDYGPPRTGVNSVSNISRADSMSMSDIAGPPESSHSQINRTSSDAMRELLENIQKISVEQMLKKRAIMGKEKEITDDPSTSLPYEENHKDTISEVEKRKKVGHVRTISADSAWSDTSSARTNEVSKFGAVNVQNVDKVVNFSDGGDSPEATDISSSLQLPSELLVVLPLVARRKFNRVLSTMERRLATAKTDMEDLVARLNQELAVRQYLSTKVKDVEGELETLKESSKENLRQAVLTERERFNQMQWDMEELRKRCLEMEVKLKEEQEENTRVESSRQSILRENENLLEELDASRQQLEHLQKHHEEVEQKSKADMKVLIKEVKSLRTSQSELKQELSRLMKEKIELERKCEKEKQRREHATAANAKLLHECEILGNRLRECSVNFLVEEEDKLIMDTSSPSDSIDLLNTSDNRIGLLLAEAQLLAQDVETSLARAASDGHINDGEEEGDEKVKDDELRKMLTDTFIDNARLRKQINSVIRCTLNTHEKPEEDGVEEEGGFPFRASFWRDR